MSSLLTLASVSGLLDLALKSAAVLLLAAAVTAVLGRASAAWRHLVWCLSVASLLLLPVLSLTLPDWRVGWLPQWTAKPTQFAATRQTDLAQADGAQPLADAATLAQAAVVVPPSATASVAETDKETHSPPSAPLKTTSPPRSETPWMAIAWPAGGLLSLVPLAIGLWQLAGLRRRSQVVGDPRWLTLLDQLRRQLAVRRCVQLRQGESALAPLTWGALRPVLLVPVKAHAWPDERRRLVLLHELAHIRRWDWLTQLVAHVACAVYWFNPLVWLAARQMRIERERACDDMVLASGARPSDYARELLALAAGLSDSEMSMLVAVPMACGGPLDDRLRSILDVRRSRAALARGAVCLLAALAAGGITPLAMLRAAPPESTEGSSGVPPVNVPRREVGATSETPDPKKEPPAGPVSDVDSAGRPADDIDDDRGPPDLRNPEVREIWDLTIEEAFRTTLANSKVLRNLGGVLLTPVGPQSDVNHAASEGANDSIQDEPIRGASVRFVLAPTNEDISLSDLQAGARNMVSDVERAYWDLYYNYRTLNAVMAGRDSALQMWRKVHALFVAGSEGGEAEKEAQAREQYFLFRAQVENTVDLLYKAESRLRYTMGLAPTDGRLIRPSDEPTTAEVRFDWNKVVSEGLKHSIQLRRGRWVLKQKELKLANARLATSGVRDAELGLAKSKASEQDQELEVKHVLTNALRDLDRNYQVSRTTFNRRVAAAKQVEAVKAAYEVGTATLDMLLDAHRRLADAEIAYYRALVDYNVAILQVHYRQGSLLEHDGILVTERTRDEAPLIDPFRPRERAGD
ncbi:MAG TPA: M56 family metallopeptidase [Pirellulales bacterium]|nr:M56 family metallopeptidase [Pirellulales bacterium]